MNQELRQAAAQAKEALEEFDHSLSSWAAAYPVKVFPEPDFKKVAELLGDNLLTCVSASNMRHVVTKLDAIFAPCRAALSALSAVLEAPTDEARSGSGVPARPTLPGELHAAIMNLPCKVPDGYPFGSELCVGVYERGHREARYAAAAMVAASPLPQEGRTDASRDVLAERERQKAVEGWTPEHDDQHDGGEMAVAAACYALADQEKALAVQTVRISKLWEWTGWGLFKPKDKRRNLVRAAALLLAEIERIDRAIAGTQGEQKP